MLFAPIVENMVFSWSIPNSRGVWGMLRKNEWATGSPINITNFDFTVVSGVKQDEYKPCNITFVRNEIRITSPGRILVEVYSVSGRLVKRVAGEFSLSVNLNFPGGVYMASINACGMKRIKKFIVK